MTVPYDERPASQDRDPPQDKGSYVHRKPPRSDDDRYGDGRRDEHPREHERRQHDRPHYSHGSEHDLSPPREEDRSPPHYSRQREHFTPERDEPRPDHDRSEHPPRHPTHEQLHDRHRDASSGRERGPEHGQNGNRGTGGESDEDSDRKHDRRDEPTDSVHPSAHHQRAEQGVDEPESVPMSGEPEPDQPDRSYAPDTDQDTDRPSENGAPADDARNMSDKDAQNVEGAAQQDADGTAPNLINLFVRNVARHVMEEQLVNLFSKYGKVESAIVVRDPLSGECRGFGFVKMYTEEAAKAAIESLRDYDFEGRKISVERAKRNAPHQRTPGAYMGIDRRIRDRYAGIKRAREYDTGYGYGDSYVRRGSYRGRYGEPSRHRYDERGWDARRDHRPPYGRPPYDERERVRRRYDEGPRYPPRDLDREQRFRERQPPVPRESADDYI